jgi:hypothetical protein
LSLSFWLSDVIITIKIVHVYVDRPGVDTKENIKNILSLMLLYPVGVVGIESSYELDDRGGRISSPGRVRNFLFSRLCRPDLRSTQSRTQWVPGALSLEVKGPGREVDHSPPSSAEVKKMWIYTSIASRYIDYAKAAIVYWEILQWLSGWELFKKD